MNATLVNISNPFAPHRDRTIEALTTPASIESLAPNKSAPYICLLNGDPLLREQWIREVKDGDILSFVTLPQGGGGGSNPIRMLALIAIMVVAPQVGFLAASGPAAGSMLVYEAATVATVIAGTTLVNTIIPPPKPPTPQINADAAAPSPTYNIQAQGNTARLNQPIPAIYGRHLIFPDFAAQPYTEFAGNDQFLYQLFAIGQGEYSIEEVRIDDTPIQVNGVDTGNFEEITLEVVPPGGIVTLFPANVVTAPEVSGQEAFTGTPIGPFVATAPSLDAY